MAARKTAATGRGAAGTAAPARVTSSGQARGAAAKPARGAAAKPARRAMDMGPLEHLLGYLLRRAQLAVFEDFIESFSALRLRPAQFSALVVIDRNPGRSQAEIAAALGIARPNFVAMMDELERRGLAERTRSETDRRSHALVLTDAGRRLLKRALQVVARHEARVSRRLGAAEREVLVRLLRRLVHAPVSRRPVVRPAKG